MLSISSILLTQAFLVNTTSVFSAASERVPKRSGVSQESTTAVLLHGST